MKKTISILFVAALLGGCTHEKTTEEKLAEIKRIQDSTRVADSLNAPEFIPGSNDSNLVSTNGLKEGRWVIINFADQMPGSPKGQKVEEGNYIHNKKEGVWKQYYPSGSLKMEINYENDIAGNAKLYNEKGKVIKEGLFKDSVIVEEKKK